jgi:hypothetical protein
MLGFIALLSFDKLNNGYIKINLNGKSGQCSRQQSPLVAPQSDTHSSYGTKTGQQVDLLPCTMVEITLRG